jgi:hypothetical protein
MLDLSYETTYRQLDDFLSYAKPNSDHPNPKVFNTHLKQGGKDKQCTHPKCVSKGKKHAEANCWIRHPELKEQHKERFKQNQSPNANTSAKKSSRRNQRNGKRGNPKPDSSKSKEKELEKSQSELKRVKAYIAKQLNMSDEDYKKIAHANESDSNCEPTPTKNKKVKTFATKIILKNTKTNLDKASLSDIVCDSESQASIVNLGLMDLCFDLEPWDGEIVTATGDEMGVIKFKGFIYFLGVKIKVYVAEIIASII